MTDTARVQVRFHPDVWQALTELAEQDRVNAADLVRSAVTDYLRKRKVMFQAVPNIGRGRMGQGRRKVS